MQPTSTHVPPTVPRSISAATLQGRGVLSPLDLPLSPAKSVRERSECGVYGFLSRRGDLFLLGRFGEFGLKLVELVKLRPAETEAR